MASPVAVGQIEIAEQKGLVAQMELDWVEIAEQMELAVDQMELDWVGRIGMHQEHRKEGEEAWKKGLK